MVPDVPRRRRGDEEYRQQRNEYDAPGFDIPKNAHATQKAQELKL